MASAGTVTRGAYHEISFWIDDPDPVTPGVRVPRNITNDDLTFIAKRDVNSSSAVLTKTTAVGGDIEIVDGPEGEGKVVIWPEDLENFRSATILVCAIVGEPSGTPVKPYIADFGLKVQVTAGA